MRTLLWLLLCALPLAAQDQDPAALCPSGTLLFAEVDGAALREGLPQLDLARMLADPKLGEFFRPAFETLGLDASKPVESLIARLALPEYLAGRVALGVHGLAVRIVGPDGEEKASFTLDALHPLIARHAFQLLGANVNAEATGVGAHRLRINVTPQFLLVVEPGARVKAMAAQVLQHVEQQALQLGDRQAVQLRFAADRIEGNVYFAPEVYADLSGDRWIVASSTELLQRAWAGGGRDSLANSRRFLDVRERMTGGKRVALGYFDVAQVATILGPLAPPIVVEAADIAGIRSIRGLGMGISLVEGGVRESFGLVLDGQPKGVWRLLDAFPGGMRSLQIAPPGAVMAVGVKFDPKLLVARMQEVANELMPGNEGLVRAGLAEMSQEAGFDVEKELVNALGDEMALILYPPPGVGMPVPNWVLGIDLADEAAFKRLLERGKAAVAGEVNIQPIEIKEGLQGFQVFAPIPAPPPVFAVASGHFLGASSRELLLEVIEKWGDEGTQSLARDGAVFKRVLNGLNGGQGDSLIALAYVNLHGLVPHLMPWAGMAPLPRELFDRGKMPTAEQLQPFLSGIALGIRRDGNGVTFDTFSPTGLVAPGIALGIYEAMEDHQRTMRMIASMQDDAPYLGLSSYGFAGDGGFIVLGLVENGPAAKAGLRRQDVIVTLAGRRIRSTDELRQVVLRHRPGTAVQVKLRRSGEEMELELTLGRRGDFEGR